MNDKEKLNRIKEILEDSWQYRDAQNPRFRGFMNDIKSILED